MAIELQFMRWILPPSLHVCSGPSTLGDVKLDLYERADVKGAMRCLPFKPGSFASVIWDPPYAMYRLQTMFVLIELRAMLRPGGRLMVVHYFDPSNFLQRSMRLLYKAYYEPKSMGGVRLVTVMERLSSRRPKPGRRDTLLQTDESGLDRLVEVPASIWETPPLFPAGSAQTALEVST